MERVTVHEADKKRGNDRRMRVDIHMNFIGAFTVPADIVTPAELEEQRRQAQEMEARTKELQERYKERTERRKQEKREFTARMKAGLLTPEEEAAHQAKLEHNRAWQKEWREKRKSEMPPQPPKPPRPLSVAKIIERVKEGLPLTSEETAKHEAYKARKNAQFKRWRTAKKASEPPKPPKPKKPTKKEIIMDIIARQRDGLPLTPEEQEAYALHREKCNAKHKKWRDAQAKDNPDNLTIEDIKKRIRDGLPVTPEESAFFESWRTQKNEYRRELYQRKKAETAVAVGQ